MAPTSGTCGNELHSRGNFSDAAEKYLRAKNNLKDIPSSKDTGALLLACSLNLMACYLKTNQHEECKGRFWHMMQVMSKPYYRRGQAYRDLGLFEDAVSDLSKAHEVFPEDKKIAHVLRETCWNLFFDNGVGQYSGGFFEQFSCRNDRNLESLDSL
ncbi:hypothetical protein AALP_AA8G236500 [Arabis alpina]|uniref:Uncharacterized protein n=1 Tax=Arabis alpina TaxID=50452 RepID=A0A087G8Z7_ARAAL|nr:hypothetical protein AALP_AA8G236500 [Arabis alpina]